MFILRKRFCEVDFVLGDATTAVEVKGKERIHGKDVRNLLEFRSEYPSVRHLVVVCLEPRARMTDEGIRILPYADFLDALWSGEFAG